MEISDRLAAALDRLVEASDDAEATPSNPQVARRAIERATLVAHIARDEGFGRRPEDA